MKIVYCAFNGRYSDNPRALYERHAGRNGDEHVWLAHPDHLAGFPPDLTVVTIGSAACVAALESADLVVANTHIEVDWQKRPGATYLQTWHGTPLKRVHHDVLWAPSGRLLELEDDVRRWDYLLSPNAASTARLQNAFGFEGLVLETGYPRNDVLVPPRADLVRARVRSALGLEPETTVVLYAPTWRDDEYFGLDDAQPSRPLDLDDLVTRLGGDHHVLLRLHPMLTGRTPPVQHAGTTDVSFYPDAQELYLAADVMVTDYSSTMFDFAVTGKPLLFFTYDLERYRDSVRGFYFDFTPVAPGPLLRTSAEVIDRLQDLAELQRTYATRYAEFRRTFCHLDDGHAAERLDWLFRPHSSVP